jgi:hypothetical protein
MRKFLNLIAAGVILFTPVAGSTAFARIQVEELAEKVAKQDKAKKRVVAKPKSRDVKVDNFVDKNNDGVDDRHERRIVRPKEVHKAEPAAKDEPKAEPKAAPRKADSEKVKRVKPD